MFDYDDSESSSSIEDEEFNYDHIEKDHSNPTLLMSKCIIHLDIDCFYCQCEEILNPTLASKPVAIGQKHIVVTANYVARDLGVKKLMGRTDALKACPSLIIIEGSDLEKYRKASREVYDEFRRTVKEYGDENIVKKGCMDEMCADVTTAVSHYSEPYNMNTEQEIKSSNDKHAKVFYYGETNEFESIQIKEDQSGACATISNTYDNSIHQNNHTDYHWGNVGDKRICKEKLRVASKIANEIREKIRSKTKFSTTIGVSVSPMLAKLASDIKKPDSTNVLYPWLAKSIILDMPLRRIPGLGSKTYKALSSCFETYSSRKIKEDEFWNCRDLLQVPRNIIITSLSEHESFQKNCELQCDQLLSRCNGIDINPIVDDGGGLSRTVSVEDSFVRGTIKSTVLVQQKLSLLYLRLIRLLDQRREISESPGLSYPRALRVSVRQVDTKLENCGRRPFRTTSKQCSFNGKALMEENDEIKRESILSNTAVSLLKLLISGDPALEINVTRLNLAAISFADTISLERSCEREKTQQNSLSNYFLTGTDRKNNNLKHLESSSGKHKAKHMIKRIKDVSIVKKSKTGEEETASEPEYKQLVAPSWIDQTVFASLPVAIAQEVLTHQSLHQQKMKEKKNPARGIQTYFTKKT